MYELYAWSKLNHLQIGKYAEYYVKMEFTLLGFDVYTAEVDDKGIDFVVRKGVDRYYDIQVKSVRNIQHSGYVFMQKQKFILRPTLFLALVIFVDGSLPNLYLIPSTVWENPVPPFVGRDYLGLKSKPEWGLNIPKSSLQLLQPYRFQLAAQEL